MKKYNFLMDIDEVVKYLDLRIDRDFNEERAIKFIKEKEIPIVFEYEGWGSYDFKHEGEYQSCNVKVNGHFSFRNSNDAIQVFKGFLNEINLHEAVVYHLDSYHIRGDVPDNVKIKQDDEILFNNGGRSPSSSHLKSSNYIKIYNNKVGVLRADLEEYIDKMETGYVSNETKIGILESEIEKLKTESTVLLKQNTEALTAANDKINQQEQDISNLNKQMNKRVETVIPLERKAGISPEKQQAKETALILARLFWKLDTSNQTKMTEMCHKVYAELYNSAFNDQLPNQAKSIKRWIANIAPEYATKAGRPNEK